MSFMSDGVQLNQSNKLYRAGRAKAEIVGTLLKSLPFFPLTHDNFELVD
jgi:hypothetical protein